MLCLEGRTMSVDNLFNAASRGAASTLLSARFLEQAALRAALGPQRLVVQDEVAVYCRQSKEKGDYSIPRQMERGAEYSNRRLKKNPKYYYEDEGYTGETDDRPGFIQMMADVSLGRIKYIIMEDFDRFGRNFGVIGKPWELIKELGIEIYSIFKDKLLDDSDVALLTLAATNHQQSLKKRSRDGVDQALEDGKVVSRLPWGYVRDPYKRGVYRIDETLREAIVWMFKARSLGMSVVNIARELPSMTKNPKRLPAHKLTIANALKNPIYKGVYVFRETEARLRLGKKTMRVRDPSEWQTKFMPDLQIVGEALWEAAGATFKGRNKRVAGSLFLSCKIRCELCGQKFYMMSRNENEKERVIYGWCDLEKRDLNDGSTSPCKARMVVFNAANKVVLDAIRDVLAIEGMEEEYQALLNRDIERQRDAITMRQQYLQRRVVQLRAGIEEEEEKLKGKSPVARDLINERIAEKSAEWTQARSELASLPRLADRIVIEATRRASLLEVFDRAATKIDLNDRDLTADEKAERVVLRHLVDEVAISPIAGTRTVRAVVRLRLASVLGVELPTALPILPNVETTYYLHNHRYQNREEVWSAYEAKSHELSDDEWAATEERFGPVLGALKKAHEYGLRKLVNLLVFAASMSIRRQDLSKSGVENSIRGFKLMRQSYKSGLWEEIRSFLEEFSPHRRRTFNPDYPNVFLTAY